MASPRGSGARRTIGGVSLLGELLDPSEAAVPTGSYLGQRARRLGEAIRTNLVSDLAALSLRVDQADAL